MEPKVGRPTRLRRHSHDRTTPPNTVRTCVPVVTIPAEPSGRRAVHLHGLDQRAAGAEQGWDWFPRALGPAAGAGALGGGAVGAYAEDPVDLGRAEVLVGLAGRDDEVGGELHLAEEVGVLERHV